MSEAQAQLQKQPDRRRRWLFRLAAITLVPVLFLLVCEIGLRLVGYGDEIRFFRPSEDGAFYRTQPVFRLPIFQTAQGPTPIPQQFPVKKKPGTYRIFVFGGSAADGFPASSFSFSRMLERFLSHRYPTTRFEVINTAMDAVNSFLVYEVARECAGYQPDLCIVYAGNNEVVGPFGPATVFSNFCPSLTMIRLSIRLRSTRFGQLLRNALLSLKKPLGEKQGNAKGMMELFAGERVRPSDPRIERVYEHFRRNLLDIIRIARGAGAKVILCTVATNVRQCAPFASMHRADLSDRELQRWKSFYEEGVALESGGKHPEAIQKYRQAAGIDDQWAALHYRLGRCLLKVEEFEDAGEEFMRARDLDALQFRADSRINGIIKDLAAGNGQDVRLVDAEDAFNRSELSPHGLPGEELFLDHVHLNFQGNYLLAKTVFKKVEQALPESIRQGAGGLAPTIEQMADELARTGLDKWRIATIVARLTERPPFTGQIDHAERLAAARSREKALEGHIRLEAIDDALATCREGMQRRPSDLLLKIRYQEFSDFRRRRLETLRRHK
ncbi:MAG: hypothetical protein J7M08_09845 [Planctomycetes bacterium]|nr:hypothetical protein [Planctomycetota bacterium]